MKDRKGMDPGGMAVMVVVLLIGITALGIGFQFIYSLTGDLGANSDRESLNILGERTQNKCDAVLEGAETDPLVVESVGFQQIESLNIDNSGNSYSYVAEFSGQDPARYDISDCSVELTESISPGTWDFTIEEGDETDSLIVEGEQQ